MLVTIDRFCDSPMGVFGAVQIWNDVDKVFECFSVECPWLDNKPNVSCIPAHVYTMVPHVWSVTGLETWAAVGGSVSHYKSELAHHKRFACLFGHTANTIDDIEGCAGFGSALGTVNGKWAVVNSGETVKKFLSHLPRDQEHQLQIRWKIP